MTNMNISSPTIHTPHNHTRTIRATHLALITFITALVALSIISPLPRARAADVLTPSRAYYQVNRPVPLQLQITNATKAQLILLDPDNKEISRADIDPTATTVDLAQSFPNLFTLKEVHYLQLIEDDKPIGSALVLQPLITRPTPVLKYIDRTPRVLSWQQPPASQQIMSGYRIYPEPVVVLHTTDGDISLIMRPDQAPNTVWNFLDLVKNGFYTHIPFHRIVAMTGNGSPFVIQAGDPSGTGAGGCAYNIDLEPSELQHDLGVISMARGGGDINTASSQFFICLSRNGTKALDGQYTSFGQTVDGLDVIKKLAATPVGAGDRPIKMPYIESAEIIPARPRTPGSPPKWINTHPKPSTKTPKNNR